MKNHVFLFLLVIGLSGFAQQNQPLTIIHSVNLINVQDGNVLKNSAILIEGKTIKAIGSLSQLKKQAPASSLINGKNKFVIPGLWDMHIHLEGAELVEDNKALLPVFLAYGITTVRDCASDLGEQVLAWREEIESGSLIGPTLFTAGRKLEGKNSIWKNDLEIENETELALMLDKLDTYDVDFVKITENTLSGDLFLKSVAAAHARGYRVSGHVPYDLTIRELIDAGFTSIEHLPYLLRLGSDEAQIKADLLAGIITRGVADSLYTAGFNQQGALDNYAQIAKTGVFVCPTLIGGRQLAYLDETDHSKDKFLSYLTDKFVSNYQWRISRMANETPDQQQQRKNRYQFLLKQLPLIQQAGIQIIAGSDAAALNTYVYPAESLIQELEIFQEAGLSSLQILQASTINGARYFGVEKTTATVDVGKVADLVILNSNPLKDIHALRSIYGMMARGKYFNREQLDQMLVTAHDKKVELDGQRK